MAVAGCRAGHPRAVLAVIVQALQAIPDDMNRGEATPQTQCWAGEQWAFMPACSCHARLRRSGRNLSWIRLGAGQCSCSEGGRADGGVQAS